MILYHGSNLSIKKIDLSKSKVGKDFSQYRTFCAKHGIRV